MAIKIKINKANIDNLVKEENNLHFIPARINGEGNLNVENNFNKYLKTDEKCEFKTPKVFENSLRGYPLTGCSYEVPEKCKGIVLTETNKLLQSDSDRSLNIQNVFDSFVYWNWDKTPTTNDPIQQAMSWNTIANALHDPIQPEV